MGVRRTAHYLMHRLGRLRGGPHAIAAGFASGAAISCTPFMGLHFVLSAALGWATRGSVIAALIGTVVGNPWTFPFIWLWIYHFGHWLIAIFGFGRAVPELPAESLTFSVLMDDFTGIFVPMVVGCVPTAILVWFLFYLPGRRVMERYAEMRRQRRIERERLYAVQQAEMMRREREPFRAALRDGQVGGEAGRPQTEERSA